jgi:hypothetical protein
MTSEMKETRLSYLMTSEMKETRLSYLMTSEMNETKTIELMMIETLYSFLWTDLYVHISHCLLL